MPSKISIRSLGQIQNQAFTFRQRYLRIPSPPTYNGLHTKPPQQLLARDLTSVPDHAVRSLTANLPHVSSDSTPPSSTSHLSFWALLQTYVITACTSSPLIIEPSIKILSTIASAKSAILSPDRNPLLHWVLKHSIYRQFCAGENAAEVQSTIARLQATGINGVILCYAREVELRNSEDATAAKHDIDAVARQDIESWAQGVLRTIRIVPEGNFVSVKFSGAGSLTLQHLKSNLSPPSLLAERLHEICTLAHSRHIKICIDAEQSTFQAGIDKWTLDLQREFNSLNPSAEKGDKPRATIFNTYQTYLCSSPSTLSSHLHLAARESFILGIKLVRGAYLGSEPRSLFWSTKEQTDSCFDTLTQGLIMQDWNDIESFSATTPQPITSVESKSPSTIEPDSNSSSESRPFPPVSIVLATHNLSSTRKALALHSNHQQQELIRFQQQQQRPSTQTIHPKPTPSVYANQVEIVYAQLQGMADHVTGELVAAAAAAKTTDPQQQPPPPQVFKYLTWGSVSECMAYLVRRAEENRDAVARTVDARRALGREVWKRVFALRR